MAKLVITPLFKPAKYRVETILGVPLQVAEYRNVPRVADLFRQVGRVEDELRFEVLVFFRFAQESQVHRDTVILQRLVNDAAIRPAP